MTMSHRLSVIVGGLITIFVLLILIGIMARRAGEGGCGGVAAGCCMFELIESLISTIAEVGCASMGCAVLGSALFSLVTFVVWVVGHRA